MGRGIEPICGASVIWSFHSADFLQVVASEPSQSDFKLGHIPLDHWLTLIYMSSRTMYRPRDDVFFSKLRDIFVFHMTPTTEQPKRRYVWGLGVRAKALGTCFAEQLVRRLFRRFAGICSPIWEDRLVKSSDEEEKAALIHGTDFD